MNPLTATTQVSFTNPYALMTPAPATTIEALLVASIVCFVVGLLLAEQTTLRSFMGTIMRPLVESDVRHAGEPL